MQINPIKIQNQNNSPTQISDNRSFGHGFSKNDYSKKDNAILASTIALGTFSAIAILAKREGYSLNLKKMFTNIKNSYIAKKSYEAPEIISMGVGSCLGGLLGGFIIDKNKDNRKSKLRESVMQIGNVSIPIKMVDLGSHYGDKIGLELGKDIANSIKSEEKWGRYGRAIGSIFGLFGGVFLANYTMNFLGNVLFKNNKDTRGIKATDFSAHLDDMVVASSYISKHSLVHTIGRVIPLALLIPGYEVGTKKENK